MCDMMCWAVVTQGPSGWESDGQERHGLGPQVHGRLVQCSSKRVCIFAFALIAARAPPSPCVYCVTELPPCNIYAYTA